MGEPSFLLRGLETRLSIVRKEELRVLAKLEKLHTRDQRIFWGLKHPLIFARIYTPEWVQAPFGAWQVEMAELQMLCRRLACAAPRDHGKTTLGTNIYPLWRICRGDLPSPEILLLGSSAPMAEKFFKAWRIQVEGNELLQYDFGLVPGRTWGSNEAEVVVRRNGQRILCTALGANASMRGHHPGLLIAEDLEDEQEMDSPTAREHFFIWWHRTVLGMLRPETWAHYLGTIVHEESLLAEYTGRDVPGWTRKVFSAINRGPDGKPRALWPEHRPMWFLEQKRAMMGTHAFNGEYMNNPRLFRAQLFTPDHLVYYDDADLPRDRNGKVNLFVTMCLDPSTGAEDPWAITVVGSDARGDWWVLESLEKLSNPADMLENFWRIHDAWNPAFIGVEQVAAQKFLKYILENSTNRPSIRGKVKDAGGRSQVSKDMRIRLLQPLWQANKIKMHMMRHIDLRYGLLRYPKQPVDSVDCLSMHLDLPRGRIVYNTSEEKKPPEGTTFQEAVDANRAALGGSGVHPMMEGYGANE